MIHIKVLVGTTRPNRFSPKVADWIMSLVKKEKDVEFEIIDLAKVNLPLFDEPVPPLSQKYEHQHTKDWVATIGKADGFIFVTGEYNHAVPAALKNAIDFVNHEWAFKPVAFVSYGADAGGARAVEQLRAITGYLKMYDLGEWVQFNNYWTMVNEKGQFTPTDQHTEAGQKLLDQLVFWAQDMKKARAALQKQSAS